MRLTWKDGLATIFVGGGVALYAAYLAGANLPLVSGPRALAGTLLALGLGACIAGSVSTVDAKSRYMRWMGAIGGLIIIAGLITVITGSEIVLAVMVGALVGMWLVTTVRHAVTKPGIDDSTLSKLIEDEKKKMAHQ